jgi:hypothetical protein
MGLTDKAAGAPPHAASPEEAHKRWEAAMSAEIERLRCEVRGLAPDLAATRVGGSWRGAALEIVYWGKSTRITWPKLEPSDGDGNILGSFDQAMLLYYLRQSDGTPPAGRWIGYRELPGGEFYHQAYQGYTGRKLAVAFGSNPAAFEAAALAYQGTRLDGPAPHAWRFDPLPRISLAACLWPGDDEMPAQASVLFDAHAAHHLPIDGLALLGSGLTGRLLRAAIQPPR